MRRRKVLATMELSNSALVSLYPSFLKVCQIIREYVNTISIVHESNNRVQCCVETRSYLMKLEIFEMERMQSTWENRVRYNLSESGVHPLKLAELFAESLDSELLGYPQTSGTAELRELIAALYPGCASDNVLVTNGTAEANFISTFCLVEPGDDVVVMVPNYMQIWGLALSLGAEVRPLWLRATDGRWAPDLAALEEKLTGRTRLIAVCNPNNPTGTVLSAAERRAICALASRVGAWILSDEVYQGAELTGRTTPSLWGDYDRLLVTCGLSKAYGLPGLRIGWVVSTPEKIAELWSYKDYTTIGPGALSDRLARVALHPSRRPQIQERTRRILRSQVPLVEAWVAEHGDVFSMIPPQAGAIAYIQHRLEISSMALFERLRDEKSVLVVPGEHFKMDRFVRIGYGGEPSSLQTGLALFSEVLSALRAEAAW